MPSNNSKYTPEIREQTARYVLENGKVAESGTHDTLTKSDGLYAKMWDEYNRSANWKVGVRND